MTGFGLPSRKVAEAGDLRCTSESLQYHTEHIIMSAINRHSTG